jgi:hypothetical protein
LSGRAENCAPLPLFSIVRSRARKGKQVALPPVFQLKVFEDLPMALGSNPVFHGVSLDKSQHRGA